MEYLAHSANENTPPQNYKTHVEGVYSRAIQSAREVERYSALSNGLFEKSVNAAARKHDLGKLLDDNQAVLSGKRKSRHLPIHHEDAGALYLSKKNSLFAAISVYSHHRGLPDLSDELIRDENAFRDADPVVRAKVDAEIDRLIEIDRMIAPCSEEPPTEMYEGDGCVFLRLLMSCLVDADHSDTAENYGQYPSFYNFPELRPSERLKQLDQYVERLGTNDDRSILRRKMYETCRNSIQTGQFVSCDSPVGSGKTTAVMAHLLRQAKERGLRRIFVVLPFITIIEQSVRVYREALTLPGENPEEVVAELHCKADFESYDVRYLTALWKAPIIVTTAVAFYETLASNQTSTLRRLHELPGSAVFIDEAHASLPLTLLPLAWKWMNCYAKEWGCYWVLGSGSLVEFWNLKSLLHENRFIPALVDASLRDRLLAYEESRISYLSLPEPIGLDELMDRIELSIGPRLVILNTVKNAAIVARRLRERCGVRAVEHISTALTPYDRGVVIRRVRERLDDSNDQNWTLVATSCVEAGVDFSFRTGFRESSSLLSLLQAAGRVNRNGASDGAQIWSFRFKEGDNLNNNPGFKISSNILDRYFSKKIPILPSLSTKSIEDEIAENDAFLKTVTHFLEKETAFAFLTIGKEFNIISSDTVTAVVDEDLERKIKFGQSNWRELQKHSVSIRLTKTNADYLKEIKPGSKIYKWTMGYDSFLGYMAGIINAEATLTEFLDF